MMRTRSSGRFVRSMGIALVLVGLATAPASGVPGTVPIPPPKILTFVEAEYERAGLDGARSPVVSPDGEAAGQG